MNQSQHDAAMVALQELDMDRSETNMEQAMILMEILELFGERNARYTDLWKNDGWIGSLHLALHKSSRLKRLFYGHQDSDELPDPDDAYDLINYCIFFLRNLQAGNKYGED